MHSSPSYPHHNSFCRPAGLPPDPLRDLRRDMMVWAEPVIADRILDAYGDFDLGVSFRSLVSTHHRRLWRALILENRPLMEQVRGELTRDLVRAGIDAEVVEEIDHSVMEELMDIVFKRFRASRETAKGFSLVLLSAASNLGASRPLAS